MDPLDFSPATATDLAVKRVAPTENPRLKQVLEALIRHTHAFVKEVEPTEGEWIESLNFLRSIGQKCEERPVMRCEKTTSCHHCHCAGQGEPLGVCALQRRPRRE